jgi:tRNA pseudouridine65 synthase
MAVGRFAAPMDILFRDEHLVAVHKPAGLLVHRSALDRHETDFALQRARDQLGQRVYPVHRLDKPVAGVLLFALSESAARSMTALFTANAVEKTYLAVVRGFAPPSGIIDYPLVEMWDAKTDALAQRDKPAQPAVSEYECVQQVELPYRVGRYATARYSLLRVYPRTGRRHQIRRHLKHIFHPIVGDTTHGDGVHNRFFREQLDCQRLLLTATALRFTHPVTGVALCVEAAPDAVWQRLLLRLDWQVPPSS